MRCRAFLAFCLATLLVLFPLRLQGQVPQEGWISLLEPAEWSGENTRGLVAQARRSIRVLGIAYHPTEITGVLINGEPASMEADEGGRVRFFGYVPVTSGLHEVEVAVHSGGAPMVRTYQIQATPSPVAYPEAASAWTDAAGGFEGRRFAVVVGVSEYEDRSIRPLKFADRDAESFYNFLRSERAGLGGFREENVTLLLNGDATYRNIRTALFNFLMGATEKDVVILYFAGHGAPDPNRPSEHYLLTYDTDGANLAGTAFPMADVSEAVRRLRSRDVIVITDACHSAAVGGQVSVRAGDENAINRAFLDRLESSTGGYVTFTASEVNQFSQEDSRWGGGHGVFTYYLLDALRGAGDVDGDHIVTLGEMFEYVRERVQRETRNAQVPTVSQTPWDRSWPMALVLGEDVPLEPNPVYKREEPQAAAPVQVVAAQPEVPRETGGTNLRRSTKEQRTGFFLRTSLGGGSATYETDGVSISGTPVMFTLSMGKFVRRNLVLFGSIATDVLSGPDLTVQNQTVQTDTSFTATQVGFGVGGALYSKSNNVFLGAALVSPKLTLQEANLGVTGKTGLGFGMVLMAGKDWMIKPSLALGGTVRMNIGSMNDQGGDPTWNTTVFGLGLSLSYAPNGLGWNPVDPSGG